MWVCAVSGHCLLQRWASFWHMLHYWKRSLALQRPFWVELCHCESLLTFTCSTRWLCFSCVPTDTNTQCVQRWWKQGTIADKVILSECVCASLFACCVCRVMTHCVWWESHILMMDGRLKRDLLLIPSPMCSVISMHVNGSYPAASSLSLAVAIRYAALSLH